MTQQEYIRLGRHKARTDLVWLARNILGMKKIVSHVHGPMTEFMQKFDKCQGRDEWEKGLGRYIYTPKDPDPMRAMGDVDKRRLLLAPRSWFKTSLNVIAHTVQLILNFPDSTCLWLHASQEVLEPAFALLKQNFWRNNVMRYYFPEFCPPANAKEFGTQTSFNIPCRKVWTASPTLGIGGIESTRTGMHYHWIKFTDIVDEKNTATTDQCNKIIYNFGMCENLLISPLYWMDVEGTRYHFSDLYGRVIDEWLKEENESRPHMYKVFVMGCYKKHVGKESEAFTPDELDAPYLLDDSGQKISRFPEEFTTAALEAKRTNPIIGPEIFNTQMLNHPVGDDNTPFPWTAVQWKAAEDMKRIPFQFHKITVDLSEAKNKKSDFFVATVCGVDRTNRHYVVDIRMGRYLPDEIVDIIFILQMRYKPLKIKIEESGFLSGLLPTIRRKSELTGIWPNFEFVRRPTTIKKAERILSFQPWFKSGLFYFSDGLTDFVKEQMRHEFTRFPKYHDDILDTLADQIQDEPVYGTLKESKTERETLLEAAKLMEEKAYLFQKVHPDAGDSGSWGGLGAL
jgi:predicted phage terminase large subunit-like protein